MAERRPFHVDRQSDPQGSCKRSGTSGAEKSLRVYLSMLSGNQILWEAGYVETVEESAHQVWRGLFSKKTPSELNVLRVLA